MELSNQFEVSVPPAEAWQVLTDVERIAPCLPGAELQEVEGEEYRGIVKVKVGPITTSYKGAARFLELDERELRAVLRAEGRETKGQGSASATIAATLAPTATGTLVEVVTDLAITGKVAQFGRGMLADVSAKLLDQFAHNLETAIVDQGDDAGGEAAEAGGPSSRRPVTEPDVAASGAASHAPDVGTAANDGAAASRVRRIDAPPAEPVDLVGVAGGSVVRRLIPAIGVVVALVLVCAAIRAWRRSRR